ARTAQAAHANGDAGLALPYPKNTPAIASDYDAKSSDAAEDRAHHEKLLADLRAKLDRARRGGPEKAVSLHKSRGKLTVRERIERLVDPDGPWLELSALAALGMYDDEVPSAGIVTGLGKVSGRWCVIAANDATVKGGTYYPETIKK